MTVDPHNTCNDCAFWDSGHDPEAGVCRKKAPVASALDINMKVIGVTSPAIWPLTSPSDWCGDFDEKL